MEDKRRMFYHSSEQNSNMTTSTAKQNIDFAKVRYLAFSY